MKTTLDIGRKVFLEAWPFPLLQAVIIGYTVQKIGSNFRKRIHVEIDNGNQFSVDPAHIWKGDRDPDTN